MKRRGATSDAETDAATDGVGDGRCNGERRDGRRAQPPRQAEDGRTATGAADDGDA